MNYNKMNNKMRKNKTLKLSRKKHFKKFNKTHKIKHIKYDFSKIHPASIILHKK